MENYNPNTVMAIFFVAIAVTFIAGLAVIPAMQEAYASHGETCPAGTVPAHQGQGSVSHCVPPGEIERACAINPAAFDECRQELPLDERYPDQGTCIDAGENKDACKAAFKADKKPKNN